MPSSIIIFCGRDVKVECDGNCKKAWGINSRPRISFDPGDEDDIAYLSDGELGTAPDDPGTYEGGHGKPESADEFPNKWCVRECERCKMSGHGTDLFAPLKLTDFSKRTYNQPWKHGEVE